MNKEMADTKFSQLKLDIMVILSILTIFISVPGVGAISVTSKVVEANFSNYSRPITLVNINIDRLGYLTYIENYYILDTSGALKYDKGVKYYEKNVTSNKLSLEILRPNSSSGGPYPAILAIVMIDNQTVFRGWFKQYRQQKAEYENSQPRSPLVQNTTSENGNNNQQISQPQGDNKLPGFSIIAVIFAVSIEYLFMRQKKRKRDIK